MLNTALRLEKQSGERYAGCTAQVVSFGQQVFYTLRVSLAKKVAYAQASHGNR